MIRFTVFGDSICRGQHISPHLTWVNQVSALLDKLAMTEKLPHVCMTNASVNGDTTRMALERMPFDIQTHKLDLGYIQFGLNDCNFWQTDGGLPRVSASAFSANLNEIIDRMFCFGARSILVGTNHPTLLAGHNHTKFEENRARYNDRIRNVVCSLGTNVTLIDHASIWESELASSNHLSSLLLGDGIHLSVSGHNMYYKTCALFFKKLITEIKL